MCMCGETHICFRVHTNQYLGTCKESLHTIVSIGESIRFLVHIKTLLKTAMQVHSKVSVITIFVNLGFFWHFETITNIRTSIKSHIYWRML